METIGYTYFFPDRIFISLSENWHYYINLSSGKISTSRRNVKSAYKRFTSKLNTKVYFLRKKCLVDASSKIIFIEVPTLGFFIADLKNKKIVYNSKKFLNAYEYWSRFRSFIIGQDPPYKKNNMKPWEYATYTVIEDLSNREIKKKEKLFENRYCWGEYYDEDSLSDSLSWGEFANWDELMKWNKFRK